MAMVNLDLLKTIVFGPQATLDDRFRWEEITPGNYPEQPEEIRAAFIGVDIVIDVRGTHWADYRRYRLTGCAHRFREDGVCDTCGDDHE